MCTSYQDIFADSILAHYLAIITKPHYLEENYAQHLNI